MGAPLRGRARPYISADSERDPIGRLLDDLVVAAGDISPDEESLLEAIRKRLEMMEQRKGRAVALEAAKRVRQIWLQALDGEDSVALRLGLN
jgi:hypothetical protein